MQGDSKFCDLVALRNSKQKQIYNTVSWKVNFGSIRSWRIVTKFIYFHASQDWFAYLRFGYKPICSPFVTIHCMAAYKTIHMYYLKKSHDSLNRSCD